ncbi:capsid protein [uncultured Allofournierella sp.]|uniref:capsid protein n=1 Tax=uncultured Allofournierella sp. TaxID=1940258 RepID=UPI0037510FA0
MTFWKKVKGMIQSWLNIQPAQGRSVTIRESVNHATNVLRNQIWYRGDASEIDQLFKHLSEDAVGRARFWAAAPQSQQIRKAHSGLPGILVDSLAGIVKADLGRMEFTTDSQAASRWEVIAAENDFSALVGKAVADTLVTGDGAFKISMDTTLSQKPILEYWDGSRVEYVRRHGRVAQVHFLTPMGKRLLREIYSPGSVTYKLFEGEKELPLAAEPSCADLQPVTFNSQVMLAVPLQFWPSGRYPGRGKSIFDSKTDAFDAHDEIISQWLDAVRAGRVQKYIPEALIPRNHADGSLMNVNAFGTEFVHIENSAGENGGNKIETVQPEIRYEAFVASYTATLDMCLQGIVSPATLGIDVGRMASAEAQREKKDITGMTRNAMTAVLEKALPKLAEIALQAQDILEGRTPQPYAAAIGFGEYGAPDFDSRVKTIASAASSSIMSVEAQVDELWGTSKDEDWKAAEVQRIRFERGVEDMTEPSLLDEVAR